MIKLIYKILIMATIITGSYLALLYYSINAVERNPDDYIAAIIDKNNMLKKAKSPKIIFVGGSNIAFGLDCEKIEDTFNMQVVNMGLYGNLGFSFMLQNTVPFIRPNDLVVLIPEYEQFFGEFSYGKKELMDLLCYFPEGWGHINKTPRHIMAILKSNASRIRSVNLHKNLHDEIYSRKSFNEHGDLISYLRLKPILPLRESNIQSPEFNDHIISELARYVEYVHSKGAEVIFIFPSITYEKYSKEKVYITQVFDKINKLSFNFSSTPQDYIFHEKYFFNTNYHLNADGRQIRTGKIIKDISMVRFINE